MASHRQRQEDVHSETHLDVHHSTEDHLQGQIVPSRGKIVLRISGSQPFVPIDDKFLSLSVHVNKNVSQIYKFLFLNNK